MSEIRNQFVAHCETHTGITTLNDIAQMINRYNTLRETPDYKTEHPRIISPYRHLDTLAGVIVPAEDIKILKDFVIRKQFTDGAMMDMVVHCKSVFESLGEDARKAAIRSKQCLLVNTQAGANMAELVINLELSIKKIKIVTKGTNPFTNYHLFKLLRAMTDTRYDYYFNNVSLETYVRSFMNVEHLLQDPKLLINSSILVDRKVSRLEENSLTTDLALARVTEFERHMDQMTAMTPSTFCKNVLANDTSGKLSDVTRNYLNTFIADDVPVTEA